MEVNKYNSNASQNHAKAKNDFHKKSEALRKQYERDLASLEATHRSREANQREVYLKQKEEMEGQTEEHIKEYDEKVKKEIDQRQQSYLKKVKTQKENFDRDRNKLVNDSNFRLDSLSSSYKTAARERERLNEAYKEQTEERFEEGLTEREKAFGIKLGEIQQRNKKAMDEFRDSQDLEKKQIQSKNLGEKKRLIQDANLLRNESNNRHQLEMERLREGHKDDIATIQNNANTQIINVTTNKNLQQEKQRQNYEKITQNINDRNAEAFRQVNQENKSDKRNLEQQFSKDRVGMQQELNKLALEPGKKEFDRTKEKLEEHWQSRVDSLKQSIVENKFTQNDQVDKMVEDQKAEVAMMDTQANKKLEAKDAEIRELRRNEISKLKDQFQESIVKNNKRVKQIENDSFRKEIKLKKEQQRNLDRQKFEFNKEINKLTESKTAVVSELRDEFAKEKTNLVESARRKNHKDKVAIRSELIEQFARKEESYEKKIESLEQEYKRMVGKYENRINNIKKKNAKEFENFRVLQQDMREDNQAAVRRDIHRLKKVGEGEKIAMKRQFERKISQAKSDADVHIAKLTERYENLIAHERTSHQKEMQRKLTTAYDELLRFKDQSKAEKAAMILQYENKLSEVENSHRSQMAKRDLEKLNSSVKS